ncbi:hypothetical protein BD413DRAFT_438860, partial [Trametes elegans]
YQILATPHCIWLGDEQYILAIGEGSMYLKLDSSASPVLVSCVFHVPNLHGNLLSVSHLAVTGHTVKFVKNGCQVVSKNDGTVLGTASLKEGLYVLSSTAITPE